MVILFVDPLCLLITIHGPLSFLPSLPPLPCPTRLAMCARLRMHTGIAERMENLKLDKHRCLMHIMLAVCEDGPFVVLNMILVLLQLKKTKECRYVIGMCSECDEWVSENGNSNLIVLVFMSSVAALTSKIMQLGYLPSIWASHNQLLKEEQQLSDREKIILSEMENNDKSEDGESGGLAQARTRSHSRQPRSCGREPASPVAREGLQESLNCSEKPLATVSLYGPSSTDTQEHSNMMTKIVAPEAELARMTAAASTTTTTTTTTTTGGRSGDSDGDGGRCLTGVMLRGEDTRGSSQPAR